MNERIQNSELNAFLLRIQDKLPANLSKQESEEIAYYALRRLQEAKESKKTKIVFNPVDTSDPLGNITTRSTGKSPANVANMRYTRGNVTKNLYGS